MRERQEQKLRRLAEADCGKADDVGVLEAKRAVLVELDHKMKRTAENMALAEGEAQLWVMELVHRRLSGKREALVVEIRAAEGTVAPETDANAEVTAALELLDRLGTLASDPSNLPAVGELFQRLNARIFLRFREEPWGKRPVNRMAGEVVTFGVAPAPVPLYQRPTSRRQVQQMTPAEIASSGVETPVGPLFSGLEGGSLGNVNRGDWI